jgi:hypothetical protein
VARLRRESSDRLRPACNHHEAGAISRYAHQMRMIAWRGQARSGPDPMLAHAAGRACGDGIGFAWVADGYGQFGRLVVAISKGRCGEVLACIARTWGADYEQFPVHLRDRGGAVPVRVGQLTRNRRRAPAGRQPGCADHEAHAVDAGAAIGDSVEHVAVQQHPVRVVLIAAEVERDGGASGQVDPSKRVALALRGHQQQGLLRVGDDAVEVGGVGGPERSQVDGQFRLAAPWGSSGRRHTRGCRVSVT